MIELLPPPLLLLAFFGASLVLAVTPGPGVFYIVARSLVQGRAVGLASVAGVALGNLGKVYSLAAAKAAPSLAGSTRLRARGQYASGATLVGLGVAAALTGRRELA